MKPHPYLSMPATVEAAWDETPTIKTFRLRPDVPLPFAAGQFVELSVLGVGEAPFTPSSSPAVSETLEITIMRVGRVTDALHGLQPGARVGIRGPLGRAYPIEVFRDREVLITGGGCGLGPLRALLYSLMEDLGRYRKVFVRYGARTPKDIVFRDAADMGWGCRRDLDVLMTVDVGDAEWRGHVGVVTTILTEELLDCHPRDGVAVMCGPPLMMRFTILKLLERGFEPEQIYLSMERNMSCGRGQCGHCRIGPYYACEHGPVFSYDQLMALPRLWEE